MSTLRNKGYCTYRVWIGELKLSRSTNLLPRYPLIHHQGNALVKLHDSLGREFLTQLSRVVLLYTAEADGCLHPPMFPEEAPINQEGEATITESPAELSLQQGRH